MVDSSKLYKTPIVDIQFFTYEEVMGISQDDNDVSDPFDD